MRSYDETLDWLYSLEKSKGIELKLERVASAMRLLGDPQLKLRCFHVAGTNGKGSCVAFLASVLGCAGHRVGTYTSPHLIDLTERLQVDGVPIARDAFVALVDEIRRDVIDAGVELTFFEVVTAAAFLYFFREEVDVAVIEVGLGGRLDATNLVHPLAAVVTSIGLDHGAFLGDTEALVAAEKGGILKPGTPAIIGSVGKSAGEVLDEIIAARGAVPYRSGKEYRVVGTGSRMSFEGLGEVLEDLEIGLRGAYQFSNAGAATAALLAAADAIPWSVADLRLGLSQATWPGRLEVVSDSPRVVLDGAHNVSAMRALVAELPELVGGGDLHVLFAAMDDKDWRGMIEALSPQCTTVVTTEVIPERAVSAEALQRVFSTHCRTVAEPDPELAYELITAKASGNDIVLVCGSLFLAGKIREILLRRKVLLS